MLYTGPKIVIMLTTGLRYGYAYYRVEIQDERELYAYIVAWND